MTTTDRSELENHARRNFMKLTAAGSFTAALVAGAAGALWSDEAAAQSANEEREREAAAEQTDSPLATHQIRASGNLSYLYNDLLGAAEGNRKLLVNHTLISDLRPEPKFSERSNDSSHRCFDS